MAGTAQSERGVDSSVPVFSGKPTERSWKFIYEERVNFILIFGGLYECKNFYSGYFWADISLYKMISEFFSGFDCSEVLKFEYCVLEFI